MSRVGTRRRRRHPGLVILAIAIVIFIIAFILSIFWVHARAASVPPDPTPAPVAMLRLPIPPGPSHDLLERGRYVAIAGDCVSCHSRGGGHHFAGGLGLQTPYGVIYSANITGDPVHGIGRWTPDDFWSLLSRGIGKGGTHIYPAMPYNFYTRISRADSDALLAWLKTVPPSADVKPANILPLGFGFRPILIGWNWLFLKNARYQPEPARGREWNRGAELVQGLGHCADCHTPLNIAGSPDMSRYMHGAKLNGWVAPDLTGNPRTGLGGWQIADIVRYLKTGRNDRAAAAGPMGEVVAYSTSGMTDPDLHAIATYLKSLPASPSPEVKAPDPAVMARGGHIYAAVCSACHLQQGRGQPAYFPPLRGDAVAQQNEASGIVQIILAGARTGPTPTRPSALTMPSFAWKLSDQQVADVATYVRNSWGNKASPVDASLVAKQRKAGHLPASMAANGANRPS